MVQDRGLGGLVSEMSAGQKLCRSITLGNIYCTISNITLDTLHDIILWVQIENLMWCNISNEEINALENIEWKIERRVSSQRSARRGAEKVGLNVT